MLARAVKGGRKTGQQITWTRDDNTPFNLAGATLTGKIRNTTSGGVRAITGTLAIVDAANGVFSWGYSAADVAEAGTFLVQFTATVGSLADLTYATQWIVEDAL
jgi:phosphosulfolactate phosphohydrolase-like enzyme